MSGRPRRRAGKTRSPELMLICLCFLLGSAVGCVFAARLSGEEGETLVHALSPYLSAARQGACPTPSLLETIWQTVRWPALALLCSFTVAGWVGVPVLLAARGFFLTFAVTVFARFFGEQGGLIALVLLGGGALLGVPVLFVLGMQALERCRSHRGRRGVSRGVFFRRCGLCAAVLAVCVIWERCFLPRVLPLLVLAV